MAQLTRISLTRRELATVLASLRFWQRNMDAFVTGIPFADHPWGEHPEFDIATDGGTITAMNLDSVDDLCARLNVNRDYTIRDPYTSAQDADVLRQSEKYEKVLQKKGGRS
jgi:hypothetical protein